MNTKVSRRKLMQAAGAAALAAPAAPAPAATMPGPRFEGKDTPKICLGMGDGAGPLAPESGTGRTGRPGVRPGGGREALAADRRGARAFRRAADSLDGSAAQGTDGPLEGDGRHDRQPDDRAASTMRSTAGRGKDEEIEKVIESDQGGGQGRAAGGGVQLVCAPRHGGLLRGDRARGSGLDRLRLRTADRAQYQTRPRRA